MIIHLEVEWDDAILERFALVIAQQSLHFALQLNWILQGALEDYRPEVIPSENSMAEPNPNYNPMFYTRCLKLLRNVERCVVYGKPRAAALQLLYEQGKISKNELVLLEQADRRFNALEITNADDDQQQKAEALQPPLDGWVELQMPFPLDHQGTGQSRDRAVSQRLLNENQNSVGLWVLRFCSLGKHVLNCSKPVGSCATRLQIDRAMGLERAVIFRDRRKSPCVLTIRTPTYQFRMRFTKEEEAKLWMRRMKEEADTTSLFQHSLLKLKQPPQAEGFEIIDDEGTEVSVDEDELNYQRMAESALKQDLTPDQLDRYEFFQNERVFVQALTDLAEELREHDRDERKKLAPKKLAELVIPPAVYLPLCNSSNIWRRVAFALPEYTRVFNTKERCPVILNFVTKRGEWRKTRNGMSIKADPNLDVAEYMHNSFDVATGQTALLEKVAEEDDGGGDESSELNVSQEKLDVATTRGSEHATTSRPNVWQEEDDQEPSTPGGREQRSPHRGSSTRMDSATSRGNSRVQRLLKESVVVLPAKLAKRLNPSGKQEQRKSKIISVMDLQTELQPTVPILDDKKRDDGDAASVGSHVSVERSSILVKDHIVFGDMDKGDIDVQFIGRATKFVSGGESWAEKSAKMLEKAIKEAKEEGGDSNQEENVQSEISNCMSKSNDDLRQEVFIMQMIHYFKSVFAKANLPLWLKTYRILSTSSSTGLLEVITDATSLDGLKKAEGYPSEGGLRKYFEIVYGDPKSASFKAAQTNFVQSLAGYAIVSYLLGLKDRHNGNIMIDTRGHLIFIDFGFAMGMAPGHEFSFERAPFKLTKEYVEVMDGVGSDCYKEFERLFVAGLEESRRNSQIALGLVEIMMYKSNYPCFSGWRYGNGLALKGFQKRLMINVPDHLVKRKALNLIRKSRQHFGTYLYDAFQKATNGYAI